jgi:hypothetical protein
MRLLELTPAEAAFLTPSSSAKSVDGQARLTRKLAVTLTARLRLPVEATARTMAAEVSAVSPATPVWQPDAALATLWLTRRLGGRHVLGAASFVPQTLIRTLDAILAECWLDEGGSSLPAALAWHIAADSTQATLAMTLPLRATDMTRWAREVIRHG